MSLFKSSVNSLIKSFKKDLFYSLINMLGLATGLASAFLIYMYVQDELTYDSHFRDSERVYRLEANFNIKGKEDKFAITQIPLAPTLAEEFPEIESYARIYRQNSMFFEKDNSFLQEDSTYYADSTFFDVFASRLIYGDPRRALADPNSIVLTSSMAKKYFGSIDITGQTLKTNNNEIFTVTGVVEDLPLNTHLKYNALISNATFIKRVGEERFNDRSSEAFWNIQVYSYIKLKPNSSFSTIVDKFPSIYDKYMRSIGDMISGGFNLMGTPLEEIHYSESILQYDLPKGNKSYLYILGFVGLFILIIAGINYMNLATARSARRAREIGMRKVTGAHRLMLVSQFLGESLVVTAAAMVFAMALILIVLPGFNSFASKQFTLAGFLSPSISFVFIGITILVGLISGLYPAFYLSSLDPVKILKGMAVSDKTGAAFRRFLVVLQFSISAFMITGSLVVSSQLKYMQNMDLGFNKSNLVIVSLRDSTVRNNLEAFKQELKKNPLILGAGASSSYPGNYFSKQIMRAEGADGQMEELAINNFLVDYDYIDMMGFRIDTGRVYSREMTGDAGKSFIINRKAAEEFNWHDKALGRRFQNQIKVDGSAAEEGEIIGVLEDFNYGSLHNPIEPLVLRLSPGSNFLGNLSIRIKPGSGEEAINWIRKTRETFNPYYPFEYMFLDEKINEYYKEDFAISKLFKIFTLLTLFVAALGLLGLSSFITQQKTREIGLRKVLGSTSGQVVFMFLKDFGRWVVIANIIAIPFAEHFAGRWLNDFYFRINPGAEFFALAFIISMVTAILTVSWQSYKASRLNPATSLKYE